MSLIEIGVDADGEAAEAISELFNRLVPGGAVVEACPPSRGDLSVARGEAVSASPDGGPAAATQDERGVWLEGPLQVQVKAYLPPGEGQDALRRAVEEGLWHLRAIYPFAEPRIRELADADWAEAWKKDYAPQRVGRRLVIVPSWLEYSPAPTDLVVRLDPGMAFGTGLHPSTRLCCAALEDLVRPGERVLDVGTGSGILAVAAARLGAGRVLGVDIDTTACQVARENVALNGADQTVEIRQGTAGPDLGEMRAWDVVVANILAPVIIHLAGDLAACLAPGGRLVVSGIIAAQADAVAVALAAAGLRVTGARHEADWVALIATQPDN